MGFLKAWHGAILMEQDRIHRALLAAQREAEEARRASEARYQTVAAQVAEGIVLIDPGTARIVDANPACHHMLGDQEEELCGLALYDLAALDPATIEEGIQQTLQEGRRKVGPRLCWRKDGSLATVKADAAVIATGSDPILSVVVHEVGERGREADSALSEHEWQLLARLAAGLSNRQIADELNLGEQTVRNYLSRLYTKLGVSSRVGAVAWFHEHRPVEG